MTPILRATTIRRGTGSRNASPPWKGGETAWPRLPRRAPISTGLSAPIPQVAGAYGDSAWGLSHYEAAWRSLIARRDEVGLHFHGQCWLESPGGWFADHRDDDWTSHCVRLGFASYERVFSRRCAIFRFGNQFMNTSLARVLTGVGARYDLTLEPGYRGRRETVPREPYRADADDVFCPDPRRAAGPWHIPMTTAVLNGAGSPSPLPYHRPVAPESNAYRTFNLGLALNRFRRGVDRILHKLKRPYLAVVIRAHMIHSPNVAANLETLRTHPLVRRFRFTTPGHAPAIAGLRNAAAAVTLTNRWRQHSYVARSNRKVFTPRAQQ